jgi:hypothetical protein
MINKEKRKIKMITLCKKNNIPQYNIKNYQASISFGVGLRQVEALIKNTDVKQVSNHIRNLGIEAEFANNSIVAACSGLTLNIFMKLGLKLPTGIFVAPFSKIPGANMSSDVLGFCLPDTSQFCTNGLETLFKRRFNTRSVFFNSDVDWNNIDMIMNFARIRKQLSTSHFLQPFIHECSHNAHIDHIYKKLGYHSPNNLGYKIGNE